MAKLLKSMIWLLTLVLIAIQPVVTAASAKAKQAEGLFIKEKAAWIENGRLHVQVELEREYPRIALTVSTGEETEEISFEDTDRAAILVDTQAQFGQVLFSIKTYVDQEMVASSLFRITDHESLSVGSSAGLQVEQAIWSDQSEPADTFELELLTNVDAMPQAMIKKQAERYEKDWKKSKQKNERLPGKSSNQDRYEIESNDTMSKADWITANHSGYGRIGKVGDIDYWKVKLPESGKFTVWLGEVPASQNYNVYVYDAGGNEVKRSENNASMDEWIDGLLGEKNQFFYLLIKGEGESFDKYGYYRLKIDFAAEGVESKPDEHEPNDEAKQATLIQSDQTVLATIHTLKDVDYYKLSLDMPSTIYLELSDISEEMDLDLFLLDSTKKQVGRSENPKNKNETISYSGNSGDYYIKVAASQKSKLSHKPYKLSVGAKTIPVILIPGIGGSQLAVDNGKVTWINEVDVASNQIIERNLALIPVSPGSNKVTSKNGVTITPVTEEYGLDGIENLTVMSKMGNQYHDLISDLQDAGYEKGKTLFGFPYDWRLDIREQHPLFQSKIKEALVASGAQKVQLVAHSMGGILVKDYLLADSRRAAQIHNVITIGTPYLGAAAASKALIQGYNFGILLLMPLTGFKIAENAPAVYQLAPGVEYEKQMLAQFNRTVYGYIDRLQKFNPLPLSELKKEYPNKPLTALAQSRRAVWDNKYPNVKQAHIVGDSQNTIIGLNRWGELPINQNPSLYIEYIFGRGDGTVPLFSANNPGSTKANIFYTKTDGHMELLKEAPVRKQVMSLLRGNEGTVAGIQKTPHKVKQQALTAYSFTGDKSDFRDLQLHIRNKENDQVELVRFTAEGDLNREQSTKNYLLEDAVGSGERYNLQIIVETKADLEIIVDDGRENSLSISSYDSKDGRTANQLLLKQAGMKSPQKITIEHNRSQRNVKADGKALKIMPLQFD